MAFCLDGYRSQVGVELRQDKAGCTASCTGQSRRVPVIARSQVARVLSLDHDATGFVDVGRRDPVIAQLLEVAPGLLPPLFYSPYEAAVWSIISARRPANQMADVRRRLAETHGRSFQLAGQNWPPSRPPSSCWRSRGSPG